MPIGAEPSPDENAALAAALLGYSKRAGPDDFSALIAFLNTYSRSPWSAALLLNLGLEYLNTAAISKPAGMWRLSWDLAKTATDLMGKAVADRAVGELAYLYASLGRMAELDSLLTSLDGRAFSGPATERIAGAREGLRSMRIRPDIAFRCGPLALHRIKLLLESAEPRDGVDPRDGLDAARFLAPTGCRVGSAARPQFSDGIP